MRRIIVAMCCVVVVALGGCGKNGAAPGAAAKGSDGAPAGHAVLPVEHDGLTILQAEWGSGTEVADVRALLESQIIDGRLQMKAEAAVLGDPAPNKKKTLMVVVDVKGKQSTQYFLEGAVVTLGVTATPVAQVPVAQEPVASAQVPAAPVAAPAGPPVDHEGLTIVQAEWGSSTTPTRLDVRGKLEALIKKGRLEITVARQVLGKPVGTGTPFLRVVYVVGGKQSVAMIREGDKLSIGVPATIVARGPATAPNQAPQEKTPPTAAENVVPAVTVPPSALLKRFTTVPGTAYDSSEGVTFTARPGTSKLLLADEYTAPLVITARVKTDSNNIRLDFGRGEVIFDWEVTPSELRYNDVKTGAPNGVKDKGAIPPNTWATIRWVVDENGTRVIVDGVERAAFSGDYAGLKGKVGVATVSGAKLTVESFDVQQLQPGEVLSGEKIVVAPTARVASVLDTQSLGKRMGLLEGFIAAESASTEWTAEGLSVRVDARSDGRVETLDEYKTPLVITAQMKTDNQNIRLMYGEKGLVILNWEANGTELRHHNPKTGENKGIEGKGSVPVNTWVTIRWTIDEKGSRVEVDGMERDVIAGNFSGLSGRVGFGQTMGSLVTLKKLEIASLAAPVAGGTAAAAGAAPGKLMEARWGAGNQTEDVTNKLQEMMNKGETQMTAGVQALGDPAVGTPKQLVLTYDNNGVRRSVTFDENDEVKLGAGMGVRVTASEMAKLAEQRAAHPSGVVVISADWGKKGVGKDVAAAIRELVSGDSLTVSAVKGMFGDGDASKQLRIMYDDGQGPALALLSVGQTLQVGKKITSYVAANGQPQSVEALAARRAPGRVLPATGLMVLDAQWGQNDKWKDVTDFCRSLASADSLTLLSKPESFGLKDGGRLNLVYSLDGQLEQVNVENGHWLQLGREVTSFARGGKELAGIADVVAKARAKYGDGLLILDARYGAGNDWKDITETLQKEITGNRLAVKVDDTWGDPAVGREKDLQVTFWDGEGAQHLAAHQGTSIDLAGKVPVALRAMAMVPRFVAAGTAVAHNFGVRGVYALKSGPRGATLSSDGKLNWTPGADQAGVQELQFSIQLDGKTYLQKQVTEVVSKDVVTAAGGDLSKLENLMRLPLAGEQHEYVVNPDMSGGALLEKDSLTVLGADGTTVVRKLQLAKEYFKVGERKEYFVAVRLKPAAMDLLDKKTGKVIKTIKLDYREVYDMALAPNKPVTYVAAQVADTVPHGRVVIVDEEKGEVREPKDFMGTNLAIDRSGKHLWVGLHDIYQNGTDYFVNPGFNVVDVPTYGSIDYLLEYDVTETTPVVEQHADHVGENGGQVRVSPDGKRVTFLSFTGYPAYTKNVGAWDARDFEKKPVVYDVKEETHGEGVKNVDYHPLLPLVVMAKGDGVVVFGRESGDKEERVKIAPGVLQGVTVKDARFSPDGLNVILECQKGAEWFMYKVPLVLSAEERAVIKRGIPEEPAEKGAPVPSGGAGGVRT